MQVLVCGCTYIQYIVCVRSLNEMGRTEVCRCQELDDLSELLLGSASAGESDMWIGWLASAGRLGPLGSALLTAAVRPGPLLLLLLPSHSVLPCMLQATM